MYLENNTAYPKVLAGTFFTCHKLDSVWVMIRQLRSHGKSYLGFFRGIATIVYPYQPWTIHPVAITILARVN